jgi:hypothetical protein
MKRSHEEAPVVIVQMKSKADGGVWLHSYRSILVLDEYSRHIKNLNLDNFASKSISDQLDCRMTEFL